MVTKNEIRPAENSEAVADSIKGEFDPTGCPTTDTELAEFFGGGSGFLPIWRPTFGSIRFFERKDE